MKVAWTKDQQKVIDARDRNLLVSAAAGSGKTAVLVERIIKMITDQKHPLDIDQLLIVTFTNAAAAEMRERIGQAIEERLEDQPESEHLQRQATLVHHAEITTMHSFCMRIMKNHFNQLDIDPSVRIGDDGEMMLMKADVMKQMLEEYYEAGDPEFEAFVETYATGKADGGIDGFIAQVFEFSMSNPWPLAWIEECRAELTKDTLEEMEETAWMKYMKKDLMLQLEEMKELLNQAVSVCLQEQGPEAYLPMITADLEQVDRLLLSKDYGTLNEQLKGLAFGRLAAVRSKEIDPEKKEMVSSIRDRIKKALGRMKDLYCFLDAETISSDIAGSRGPIETLLTLAEDFTRRYQEKKKEKNVVDFNDLEHYALEVLVTLEGGKAIPTIAADQLSGQYEEILVDEYQDSNYVQETIINSISKERFGRPNIFMVGDVKQSIYRFRLARPELFMEKYESYGSEDGQYQKIELHQNFRSRASVLDSINDVFYGIMSKNLGNIQYTEETALHPGAKFEETDEEVGTPTELLLVNVHSDLLKQLDEENADYTSREVEAKLIAGRIHEMTDPETGLKVWDKKLQAYRSAKCGDMVILLRSITGWAEPFTNVLMNEGIKAYAESKTGYFNTVEVETVLSILSIIDNPMQDIALAAVLRSPIGSVTDEELAVMKSEFKKSADRFEDTGLYGAWRYYISCNRNDVLSQKLDALWHLLEELMAKARFMSIHELIYEVFECSGYYDYISAMPLGETRRANLDMLVEKAVAYESTSYHGLFHFIRYIDKLKKYNTDFGEAVTAGEEEDTVRIMSIHKSKGLEFPIVFLAGMGKNFNKQDAYSKILIDPDLGIGADYLDLDRRLKTSTLKKNVLKRRTELESMGEELRVLYVAMTRAKEKLVMTATDRNLDRKLEKWKAVSCGGKIPFTVLSAAGSCLDWLLMSLSEPTGRIIVIQKAVEDVIGQEMEQQLWKEFQKEDLLHYDTDQVYHQEYREYLDKELSYQYPYEQDITLHAKVSVSELKKAGQMQDMEESDFLPTVPHFLQESKEEKGGVFRGSAYHRALELLPFGKLYSCYDVTEALEVLLKDKRLTEESYELLDPSLIWGFVDSDLGRRMSAADRNGKLYREKQFVIGIPAREMERGDSDERILIQGIIDSYFEEEGELVLADYKTDHVTSGQEQVLVHRYQTQLDYYQKALEQISGMRVKEKLIYSFALQRTLAV